MKKRELRAQRKQLNQERHHFIPQFYLRPWLGDDNKLQEFGRVPPSGQIRSRRMGTASVGFAMNLYTLPGVTEDTQQNVEREFYGAVDRTAAAVRDKLLAGSTSLTKQERHDWARFILSLEGRHPEEMARLKAIVAQHVKDPTPEMRAAYLKMRLDRQPKDWDELTSSLFDGAPELMAIMGSTKLIANAPSLVFIENLHWYVLDTSEVTRKLITSDRPVIFTGGIAHYEGHIALPISPDKLFVATSYKEFGEGLRRWPQGRLVRECNRAIIGQARHHVYGVDASILAEVRRQMSKDEFSSLVPAPKKPSRGGSRHRGAAYSR
ncbi:DUF4238 domain-containing protein (plasmid) [Ensifer sp. D2-11]